MSDASPWTDLTRPPLRVAPLRRALVDGGGPWTSVDVVSSTGSTNDDLAARAKAGTAAHGAVLMTDHQRAGRGRHDRIWTAPPRTSLAVSVFVVPGDVPQARWSWLPLLTGVAVARALATVAGASTALKWPNDVLVEQDTDEWRKIAGVLASVVSTPGGPGVVVGMGVNVLQRADELPVDTAASLATVAATTTDLDTVVRAVLRELGDQLERWLEHRGDPTSSGIAAAYLAACRTVGRDIRVHLPDSTVLAARAESVDADGRLVVRPHDGSPTRALAVGDVVHVR